MRLVRYCLPGTIHELYTELTITLAVWPVKRGEELAKVMMQFVHAVDK